MRGSVREGDILSASVKRVRYEILTNLFNGSFVDGHVFGITNQQLLVRGNLNSRGRTARFMITGLGYVNFLKTSTLRVVFFGVTWIRDPLFLDH